MARPSALVQQTNPQIERSKESGMANEADAKLAPVLSPIERSSEVVFGVLMALSFTGSLSVATAGREEVRTLLFAAFGCNLAWGLTDAVMYLISAKTERHRNHWLLCQLQQAADPAQAHRIIVDALPAGLARGVNEAILEGFRRQLLATPVVAPALSREDYVGALGVFLVVVLSTFPVVLPFMLIADAALAMRVSQGLGIATLFVSGVALGRHAGGSGLRWGATMTAIGVLLVLAIIELGG